MQTMVLFDVPSAFVAAGVLSRRAGRAGPARVFVGLGMAPAAVAFFEAWPAWDTHYLVEPDRLPAGMGGLLVLAVVLAGEAGIRLCKRPLLLAGVGLATLAGNLATGARLWRVGSRAAFRAGAAPVLPREFVAFAVPWFVWCGLLMALCWRWALPPGACRVTIHRTSDPSSPRSSEGHSRRSG